MGRPLSVKKAIKNISVPGHLLDQTIISVFNETEKEKLDAKELVLLLRKKGLEVNLRNHFSIFSKCPIINKEFTGVKNLYSLNEKRTPRQEKIYIQDLVLEEIKYLFNNTESKELPLRTIVGRLCNGDENKKPLVYKLICEENGFKKRTEEKQVFVTYHAIQEQD